MFWKDLQSAQLIQVVRAAEKGKHRPNPGDGVRLQTEAVLSSNM